MRKAIAFVLYWLYFLRIKREVKRTDSVLTIYGHDISREAFEGLVKWLLKRDYHFITQDELFDYLDGKERNVENLYGSALMTVGKATMITYFLF